jgi:periodic tryptophan protein 1
MITCTTWVPRGFAAENPRMAQLDDAEMERISELAKLKLEDAQEDLEDAEAGNDDDEEAEEEDDAMEVEEKETTATGGSGAPVAEKKSKKDDEDKDDDLAEYNLDDYDEPTEEEKQMGTSMSRLLSQLQLGFG